MKYLLINKSQQKTAVWSGGTTTEMYLWPENGNYAAREFSWRVSSATVDADTSVFTPLPGIDRWIMPFDEALTITHNIASHKSTEIILHPYESHFFDGGWETTSRGKTRDFNLMLKKDCYGFLKHIQLHPNQQNRLSEFLPDLQEASGNHSHPSLSVGLYAIQDAFTIAIDSKKIRVAPYELFLIQTPSQNSQDLVRTLLHQNTEMPMDIVLFFVLYDPNK